MASLDYFLCVLSLCVSVTLINPITCYAQYVFVFGDSLYDPGNNQYVTPGQHIPAYFPPYGTTFFNHSTGRWSDGRIVADFISAKLNLKFLPPALEPGADFTNGTNFASGGAGILSDDNTYALNFNGQYMKFDEVATAWSNKVGYDEAKIRLSEAVYLICIGGVDYFAYASNNANATIAEMQKFVDQVLAKFTVIVEKIYELGARKFVFQNVAPAGCLPNFKQSYSVIGNGCVPQPTVLATIHNLALKSLLESLATNLSGFTYSIFDYFTAISNRLSNPQQYGFEAGDIACCGDGTNRALNCGITPYSVCSNASTHVFWDGAHNTDAANEQLSQLIWDKDLGFISPYGMKDLFGQQSLGSLR